MRGPVNSGALYKGQIDLCDCVGCSFVLNCQIISRCSGELLRSRVSIYPQTSQFYTGRVYKWPYLDVFPLKSACRWVWSLMYLFFLLAAGHFGVDWFDGCFFRNRSFFGRREKISQLRDVFNYPHFFEVFYVHLGYNLYQ